MPSLELLIDASRMPQGAAQANAALKSVQDAAATTETAVKKAGTGISTAFGAGNSQLNALSTSGNIIQVGTGISQVARAFADLNVTSAAFHGARVVLDFAQIRASVSGAGGAFSALGTLIKGHPILTIASVIASVAGVMTLLSDKTAAAAINFKELAKAQREIQSQTGYAQFIRNDQLYGSAKSARIASIDSLGENVFSQRPDYRADPSDVASSLGISKEELLRRRLQALPGERIDPSRGISSITGDIARDQLLEVISALRRDLVSQGETARPVSYFNRGEFPPDYIRNPDTEFRQNGNRLRTDFVNLDQSDIGDAATRAADQQTRHLAEKMEELKQSARQVGEYLGDGIADAVLQARSLKDVVGSIAQDLARSFIRQATGNLAAGIANSFGSTGAQGSGASAGVSAGSASGAVLP